MRMYDIIEKKRDKQELSKEEIDFFVNGYSKGDIPDYQMSALLMAIYLNGMTPTELKDLTFSMANSAKTLDLSSIKVPGKYIVDKHSTGGVGDKVTLIVLPIVASLGVGVCKMSGRGLGFTGGTIDKLESITGYNVEIPINDAIRQVQDIGVCLIAQSSEIAIADKKIYALRDTTATIESINLIASSIMSKKLASGVDKIAVVTSMSEPLGRNVGNALEIKEVISFLTADEETLDSDEYRDLREVVFEVAAQMIKMSGVSEDLEKNKKDIREAILSRDAYRKFIELVKAQGGHIYNVYMDWLGMSMDMPVLDEKVKYLKEIRAHQDGYIVSIDSRKIGEALVALGGGRNKKEDSIDYSVGFEFAKKVGEKVQEGDTILTVYYNDKNKFNDAYEYIADAINIDNIEEEAATALRQKPHILDIIDESNI